MASSEDVRVAFNIDMETRNLHKALRGFDQSVRKSSQQVGALGKALSGGHTKQFAEAEKAVNHFRAEVVRSEREILKNREDLAAASTEVQRESIQEQIKEFEALKLASIKNAQEASDEIGEILNKKIDLTAFKKSIGEDLKGGLEEGFASFKAKDISGLLKGGGKLGSGILKAIGGYGGAGAAKGGAALQKKGGEMGGMGGKGMEMLGSILGKMAPLIGTLAKMGPLLSAASGIFAGIVKMMIDVESTAKQLNKELMQGGALADGFADSMSVMGANFNKPVAAAGILSDQLQTIKDQISGTLDSAEGLAAIKMHFDMGTTAKDHYAVIDAMKKEGMTTHTLRKSQEEAKNESEAAAAAGQKSLATLSQGMTKYTGLTSLAVAYSRQFGVSLDEIGSLQGELMSELKMGATGMAMEYSRMTTAAVESGIGVGKFFNIIRGVSTDLSLYGMRLKDVTKTLALMGKTMSPRTAAKFMQTLTQGFKGKSMQDRLKTSLIGGGGVTKAAQEDVTDKMDDLLREVMSKKGLKTKDEAKKAIESGEVGGAEREALMRLTQRQKSLDRGGPLGTASAMADMGPAGVADAMKATMLRFGGGKTLKDMSDLGVTANEQATGYSQEEQLQTMAFFDSIEDQKKKLKKLFEKAGKKNEVLSKDEREKMEQVQAAGMHSAEDVDKASTNKIYKSLDKSAEDQAKEAAEQMKAAHESGKLAQSALDKMDIVIDALFNWLYKVLVSLWDGLEGILSSKLFGGDNEARQMAKLEIQTAKTRNNDLIDAVNKSGGDRQKVKGNILESPGWKKIVGVIEMDAKTNEEKKQQDAVFQSLQSNLTRDQLKEAARSAGTLGKITEITSVTPEEAAKIAAEVKLERGAFSHESKEGFKAVAGAGSLEIQRKTKELQDKKEEAYFKDLRASMGDEDYKKTMVKSGWAAQDEQLIKMQAAAAGQKVGGAAPTPGAPAPSAAPAPGTPGTPGAAPMPVAVVGPAPAPVAPAAGPTAAGPTAPAKTEDKVVAETIADGGIEVVKSLQDLWNAMRVKGIKIDKTMTIENHFKKAIEEGSLAAIRKGLFEYAMYSTSDPKKLLDQIEKSGPSEVKAMGKAWSDDPIRKNATGGIVTSVSGGIANIKQLPPGEGLASIGPGEKITPAGAGGGGGGSINLTVNGIGGQDLANFLKVKIAEGIYEYKRREKLT